MLSRVVASVLLGLAGSGCRATTRVTADDAGARASFARLKSLAGTWVTVQEDGTQPAGQYVRYEITARGTALVETLFAGTQNEMLSVYAIDGGALELTHYCSLGNQPRMRAVPSEAGDVLAFELIGGANLDPARDTHMHRAAFEFVDDTHLRVVWTLHEQGRAADLVRLALVRSWSAPARR